MLQDRPAYLSQGNHATVHSLCRQLHAAYNARDGRYPGLHGVQADRQPHRQSKRAPPGRCFFANLTPEDAAAIAGAETFNSQAALAKLAAEWPAERLVGIWNGIPGVTATKKFKDPKTGVSRIWKAIQSLVAATKLSLAA
jgi:hypothetical protein